MEDKLVDLLDKWGNGVADVATMISEATMKHGPAVADFAMLAVRVDCIAYVILWAILAITAYISVRLTIKLYRRLQVLGADRSHCDHSIEKYSVEYIITLVCTIAFAIIAAPILTVTSFVKLLDIWRWIGMFSPELYTAHNLIEAALSTTGSK